MTRGTPIRIGSAALVCAMIADWTITVCLVLFLREHEGSKMRTLLQTLTRYAVNFGLLIGLTDLVVVILASANRSTINLYQLSIFEIVGSLYANTILASLNSRELVADHLSREQRNIHLASISYANTNGSKESVSRHTNIEPITLGNGTSTRNRPGNHVHTRPVNQIDVTYESPVSDPEKSAEMGEVARSSPGSSRVGASLRWDPPSI
ncbi:hypothetical protein P691DRAFT_805638 [Macrolepiota fuliginosa MF-IS2]|uniref:DUF6534 domain-containing protein n=1 Tax=Macrolepiota fuliginosa MF-IS2 TaxID=1400762 RepID=A0A9P6C8C2_9AGAR|nr:hypothetical protein P691DRAFT_805638 [Macrolepiota fuliginosa MF-IS2]